MASWSTKSFGISTMALAVTCGVGSVLLFAFYPMGSLALLRWSWSEPWLLCWDALLSCVFFLQHSGMNRTRFRSRLSSVVAPRYHGAVYGIASGAALTLVVVLWQPTSTELLVLDGPARSVAGALGVLAIAVFIWSACALLHFDPLGLGPIQAHLRNLPSRAPRFVVRGPYRWVRHPLYSCIIVMIWTCPALTTDRLLFNLLWTLWICVGAILEGGDLTREFGDVYRDYCHQVPMLIPWRGRAGSCRGLQGAAALGVAIITIVISSQVSAQALAPVAQGAPAPMMGGAPVRGSFEVAQCSWKACPRPSSKRIRFPPRPASRS